MSTSPIQIVRYGTRTATDALLHSDLSPGALAEVEQTWGPIRRAAARRLVESGTPPEHVPRHWHWDWSAKSQNLQLLAYRCFGIECEQKMQGLMMVLTAGKQARLSPDTGKPLVYVDYLESAPWNVIPFVTAPIFGGIGMVLMRVAVQLSLDEGFQGRVALHALPQAVEFYQDKCGMQGGGNDPQYQNLPYFEMTRDLAQKFISS